MIAASRFVVAGALGVALAVHGIGLKGFFPEEDILSEGSSGAVSSMIGNSFEDMIQGAATPKTLDDVIEPEEMTEEVTEPVEPDQTVEDVEPTEALQEQPSETEDVPVEEMIEAKITPLAVETVVPILPMQPTEVQPTEVARPQPTETVEAVEENTTAVARSLRPKPRTPEFEKKHEPPPPRQQVQQQPRPVQQTQPAPQGSTQNANRGGANASQANTNSAASGTGTAAQQGNASVSNYPGKVMRKLSRVSRPRGVGRGTAVVAFRVSGSGGLSGASIARSSGNAQLDQAALSMVRRAAPFPAPPPGAKRSFSISIQGR
ncbi:MAG: TonB family protein [Pseudomonadota bacterium]